MTTALVPILGAALRDPGVQAARGIGGSGDPRQRLAAVWGCLLARLRSWLSLFPSSSLSCSGCLTCFFLLFNVISWLLDVGMRALFPALSVWPPIANPFNPGTPLFPPPLIQYLGSLPSLPTLHLLQGEIEGTSRSLSSSLPPSALCSIRRDGQIRDETP